MEKFFWICLAGALGTGTRYLVNLWAVERFGGPVPVGTIVVNLAGCFAIAFLMELSVRVVAFPPNLRMALTVGFLGGLTTYSSFNFETTKLARDGAMGLAAWNFGVTTFGGFAAGLAGFALARYVASAAG